MVSDLLKIFAPTVFAFFVGIFLTPIATHFFYKYKMWKKYSRNLATTQDDFKKIHNQKEELKTPRIGGIIIWYSVIITTLLFQMPSIFSDSYFAQKMNFLSRNQTLIPFFTLVVGAIVGLIDDLIQIYSKSEFAKDHIKWRMWKVFIISSLSVLIGSWFFYKLNINSIHIPFNGDLYLGIFIIPFFILVALATFSGSVIDGLDGLAGGVLAAVFGAYSVIAFANKQMDLAAFSGIVSGGILAFLWFNIPPARFYMGETGMISLTLTISTLAFLTNSVLLLPIIAFPLVITSLSDIIQMTSKKFRNGKKVFRVAPLHHHFEALGWPSYKVTMRFWIIGIIFAMIGAILAIISK